MARKLIRRFVPDTEKIRGHKHLRFLGKWLHNPRLWHLNRRSVAGGAAIGLFMAFIPMPLQMLPAAVFSVIFKFNMPIAVALVWITNPFTIAPISYFAYKLGGLLLGLPVHDIAFEPTWEWLVTEFRWIWQPFVLGSFVVSAVSAVTGYFLVHALWRMHVIRDWKRRKLRRASISR